MPGFIILLFLALMPGFPAADPDFSGTWRLNPDRSNARNALAKPAVLLRIKHSGNEIHCDAYTSSDGDTAPVRARYLTNGQETRNHDGAVTLKSILKWEGSALLVNTLVSGRDRSHSVMDRWKLSRDGQTLAIRRQVVTLKGESEALLIYEKKTE